MIATVIHTRALSRTGTPQPLIVLGMLKLGGLFPPLAWAA